MLIKQLVSLLKVSVFLLSYFFTHCYAQDNVKTPTASPSSAVVSKETQSEQLTHFEQEFTTLTKKIATFERDINDYAEFYNRLKPIILQKTLALNEKIQQDELNLTLLEQVKNTKKLQHLLFEYTELKNYFSLRLRLFNAASPEFVKQHTNTKLTGINEAKLEYHYLQVHLYLIYEKVKQRVLELPKRFSSSPITILSEVTLLFIVLTAFKLYRVNMAKLLPSLQKNILVIRTQTRVQAARFVWYIDQTRSPIEWLILIHILISQLDLLQMPLLDHIIWSVTFWLCFTLFSFKLLSKIISRGKQALTKDISAQQTLALKLLVFWFGFFMMTKELTLLFVENATLYSWVTSLLFIIALPIYFFFIRQWKNNAFLFITQERDSSIWAVNIAQKKNRHQRIYQR